MSSFHQRGGGAETELASQQEPSTWSALGCRGRRGGAPDDCGPLGDSPRVSTWAEPQMRRCYSTGWGLVDRRWHPSHSDPGAERSPADLGKQQGPGRPACGEGEGNWTHGPLDQVDQQLKSQRSHSEPGAPGGSADFREWTDSCSSYLPACPGDSVCQGRWPADGSSRAPRLPRGELMVPRPPDADPQGSSQNGPQCLLINRLKNSLVPLEGMGEQGRWKNPVGRAG